MSKAHRQRTFIGKDIPRSHYSEKRMSGSFPDRNYSGRLTSQGLRQFAHSVLGAGLHPTQNGRYGLLPDSCVNRH
jgi:hypothetical protein